MTLERLLPPGTNSTRTFLMDGELSRNVSSRVSAAGLLAMVYGIKEARNVNRDEVDQPYEGRDGF